MTRLEELTLNLADDVLSDVEASELEALVAESDQARQAHIRILQIETGLRGQKEKVELTAAVMTRLRSQVAESVAKGVMTQIRTQPTPEWVRQSDSEKESAKRPSRILSFPFPLGWTGLIKHAWLPLAACLALAGLGLWFFGPTVGEPMLADVQGSGVSLERSGQRLPARAGVRLHTGDVLRTTRNATAVVGYAPEETRITLLPGTEFKLTALGRGKRFDLRLGELEASVARQRPFQPMVLTTPQAQARVVGTRFTLTVSSNATRLDVAEGKIRFTRQSDSASILVSGESFAVAAAGVELSPLPRAGGVEREIWTNVPGEYVLNLQLSTNFSGLPDGRGRVSGFEVPDKLGQDYGGRIRGYLLPPVTGDYTFWITAADEGQLLLSPDDIPEHRQQIGTAWYDQSSQQSAAIRLTAGRKYYIEVKFKVGKGHGHLALTWQGPGRPREVIPGDFLAPYKPK